MKKLKTSIPTSAMELSIGSLLTSGVGKDFRSEGAWRRREDFSGDVI